MVDGVKLILSDSAEGHLSGARAGVWTSGSLFRFLFFFFICKELATSLPGCDARI